MFALPVSPSGLPLEQEVQMKRQMIEQKQKYLEEYDIQSRQRYALPNIIQ